MPYASLPITLVLGYGLFLDAELVVEYEPAEDGGRDHPSEPARVLSVALRASDQPLTLPKPYSAEQRLLSDLSAYNQDIYDED